MGKTYRKQRELETTRGRNKSVNWQEKAIDKHKKAIYNVVSAEEDSLDTEYDDADDSQYYESNHTQLIQRKQGK